MFSRQLGGIENAFLQYDAALTRLGIEHLNLLDMLSPLLDSYDNPMLETIEQHSQYDVRAILHLRRLIKAYQPDIILTHGNRARRLLGFANAGIRTKTVTVLHRHRFKGLKKQDAILCVSKHLLHEAQFHKLPAQKLHHMPNIYQPATKEINKTEISSPPLHIGYLGRFVEEKGADLLIHAIAKLHEQGIQAKLTLAGGGLEEIHLRELVAKLDLNDHITFLGWVHHIDNFFETVDLLCLPSRHESFGLVILEAWHHQRPIIATKAPGPKELINHEQNGLLCHADSESIAETLIKVIQGTPEMLHGLQLEGLKSLHDFLPETLDPKLHTILESFIKP